MKTILLTIILAGLATPAFAYLDPGTGSLIIQALVAAFAFSLMFFKQIKQKIFGKKKTDEETEEDEE